MTISRRLREIIKDMLWYGLALSPMLIGFGIEFYVIRVLLDEFIGLIAVYTVLPSTYLLFDYMLKRSTYIEWTFRLIDRLKI